MDILHHPFVQTYAVWIVAAIGAVMGSFLSMITYRLPKGQSIFTKRSHCIHCGAPVKAKHLIPVFSWLLLKGKTACCNKPLPVRYLLIELTSAIVPAFYVNAFGLSAISIILILMFWCVLALIVTDLETYLLPDPLVFALAIIGLIYVTYVGYPPKQVAITALISFGIGIALYYFAIGVLKKHGLGLGDVKLFGVVGIWLVDPVNLMPFMFFAGLIGVALGIFWRLIGRGEAFPFGPAILVSLMACVVCPEVIVLFWQLYA